MQQTPEEHSKKVDLKLKLIKDFGFLLALKPIPVNEYCTKYLLEEGQSDVILRQDQEQFDMVYSYIKYDYEGKIVVNVKCAKTSKLQKTKSDFDMKQLLLGMKVKEKAWFNVCNIPVYRRNEVLPIYDDVVYENQDEQIDDFNSDEEVAGIKTQTQQKEEEKEVQIIQSQPKKVEDNQQNGGQKPLFQQIDDQPHQRTGFHYQIYMEKLEYKNSENFESKMKVVEQKREEAKNLFFSAKYQEAAKIYNYLDSITSNLRKYKKDPQTGNYSNEPFYTPEEVFQIQNKNEKAKINYLRCFFKMIEKVSSEQKQIAQKNIQYLLQKQNQDPVVHFLHAKWHLHLRYLDAALDSAKRSYQLQKNKVTWDLIELIQYQIANKHKVKVKVPVNPA